MTEPTWGSWAKALEQKLVAEGKLQPTPESAAELYEAGHKWYQGWLSVPAPPPLYPDGPEIIATLTELWPALKSADKIRCPAGTIVDDNDCFRELHLFSAIIHLNDYHGWTREAIADWLETLDVDLKLKERP